MTKPALGLGGFALIGLLAAWMVPPTTPRPAGDQGWRATARSVRPNVADASALTAPPAPAPAGLQQYAQADTAPAQYSQPAAPVRPRQVAAADDQTDDVERSGDARDPADRYASDDGAAEARYRQGYDWASRYDVEDPRQCRRWRGDPGEDGCMDYLRDQDTQERRAGWGEW